MGQAIHAGTRLNIADAMADGSRSVDDIVRRTGTHAPTLRRLLRMLAGGGIVIVQDHRGYILTALGHTLRADIEGSVRAAVIWVSAPMHHGRYGELADSVTTGAPVFDKLFGAAGFDHLAADPHPAKIVDTVMMGVLPNRGRIEAEFAPLLGAAGCQLSRVIPTRSMLAIVEGRPV